MCSQRLYNRGITAFGYELPKDHGHLRLKASHLLTSLWDYPLKGLVMSFIWITIIALGFSISNQRGPASIQEDSINKPWRPIPSGRISPSQATSLLRFVVAVGFLISMRFGGLAPYIVQLAATYHYNDLGGAQGHYIIRDLLNAIGMTSWLYGCIDVAGGVHLRLHETDPTTALLLVAAITMTIAVQDLRDLDGDRKCGRATLPIIFGNRNSRIFISASIFSWSFAVMFFVGFSYMSVLLGLLGLFIGLRLLLFRSRSADKLTTEFWYGWFAALALTVL